MATMALIVAGLFQLGFLLVLVLILVLVLVLGLVLGLGKWIHQSNTAASVTKLQKAETKKTKKDRCIQHGQ